MTTPQPPAESESRFYNCFACHTVVPIESKEHRCSCGSMRGEFLSKERFQQGFNAGTYYSMGRDGKRLKR